MGLKEGIRIVSCRFCGSQKLWKYGKRKGRQLYKCKECGRKSAYDESPQLQPAVIHLDPSICLHSFQSHYIVEDGKVYVVCEACGLKRSCLIV